MSDAESSTSSRSSGTPPPVIVKKKSSKSKGKKKATLVGPRNEGKDPNWDYAPPPGVTLVEGDVDGGELDWDNVEENEDLELWLIRVPETIKPKHLSNIKIDIPSEGKTGRIGSLKRKVMTYDIWAMGEDGLEVGGEELKSISCLLPRKSKKGKLYPAPKPFSRHLVISAPPVVPSSSSDPQVTGMGSTPKNPPRFSYPKEVLKHRFLPYGFLENVTNEEDVTMEDITEAVPEAQPSSPKKKRTKHEPEPPASEAEAVKDEPKKTKGKKRKGETGDNTETPATKKSRKNKAA